LCIAVGEIKLKVKKLLVVYVWSAAEMDSCEFLAPTERVALNAFNLLKNVL